MTGLRVLLGTITPCYTTPKAFGGMIGLLAAGCSPSWRKHVLHLRASGFSVEVFMVYGLRFQVGLRGLGLRDWDSPKMTCPYSATAQPWP